MLSKVINKIRKKGSHAVLFLGDVFVNPRSSLKAAIEWNRRGDNSPENLKDWISDLLELPKAEDVEHLPENSIILDVVVTKYQAGTDLALYADPLIPFMWRPSVKMKVRLRDGKTLKVLGEFSTKSIMSWREYFSRVFSIKSVFSFKSTFTSGDLKKLLAASLLKSLAWAKRHENS